MEPTGPDTAERLTYEEAIRASSEQVALIESLRNRAGLVLSVAAISSSFLGSRALERNGASALAWLALSGFAVTAALCLSVLRPRAWELTSGAKNPFGDVLSDLPSGRRHVGGAVRMHSERLGNLRSVERLGVLLGLASDCFALDVVLWLATVALG